MRYKGKRAKATDISKAVKLAVAARDNGCCILCGIPAPSNAHYRPRSRGGLGVEENIVTLCLEHHREFDGVKHGEYKPIIRGYLKECYPGWDEKNLIYRKWV